MGLLIEIVNQAMNGSPVCIYFVGFVGMVVITSTAICISEIRH